MLKLRGFVVRLLGKACAWVLERMAEAARNKDDEEQKN